MSAEADPSFENNDAEPEDEHDYNHDDYSKDDTNISYDDSYEEYLASQRETAEERKERFANVRQEQIELLGSEALYERVNTSFKLLRFEPAFAREQIKLFKWRKNYFHKQFKDRWTTDGADDSHAFDTVPFQITQHFEEVVAKANPKRDPHDDTYFDNNELKSHKATSMFDFRYIEFCMRDVPRWLKDHRDLTYSDALHIIAAAYQSQPLSLEQMAMKKVLEIQVPLTVLPRTLQEKAVKGMFHSSEEVEQVIDDEGKQTLAIFDKNVEMLKGYD